MVLARGNMWFGKKKDKRVEGEKSLIPGWPLVVCDCSCAVISY